MKNNTVWVIEETYFIGSVMDFSHVIGVYATRDKALSVAVDMYVGAEWDEWGGDNGQRCGFLELEYGRTYRIDIYKMEVES